MNDHSQQPLTTREMVRAHTYPVLAGISSLSLLMITVLLVPQAVKSHRYNRCIDAQINMRQAINPQTKNIPGGLHYLKALSTAKGDEPSEAPNHHGRCGNCNRWPGCAGWPGKSAQPRHLRHQSGGGRARRGDRVHKRASEQRPLDALQK